MGTDRDRSIGETIARFRIHAGMSQAALAEAVKRIDSDHRWSQATVWSVEKGDRPLKAAEVPAVAHVLRVSADVLVYPSSLNASSIELRKLELDAVEPLVAAIASVAASADALKRFRKRVEGERRRRAQPEDPAWPIFQTAVEVAASRLAALEEFHAGFVDAMKKLRLGPEISPEQWATWTGEESRG